MSVLLTLSDARAVCGIPATITQHDTVLELILDGMDAKFMSKMDLPGLTQQTYDESFDIDWAGVSELLLKAYPVISVAAMTDDGTLVESDDYVVDNDTGRIELTETGAYFTVGKQTIDVQWDAGFLDEALNELKSAAMFQVAHEFRTLRSAGHLEQSVGRSRSKASQAELDPRAEAILNRYRKVF